MPEQDVMIRYLRYYISSIYTPELIPLRLVVLIRPESSPEQIQLYYSLHAIQNGDNFFSIGYQIDISSESQSLFGAPARFEPLLAPTYDQGPILSTLRTFR